MTAARHVRLLLRRQRGGRRSRCEPPGLSAIAYRVGTHADFLASMIAGLTRRRPAALAELGTRDRDDFTIALLDAWAVVATCSAFYTERLAQESYLRTARERISLQELGRLIGYRLRPGVAAETHLAFALERPAEAPPGGLEGSRLGAAGDARRR